MGGLTAADLAELRALDALFMPDTCVLVTPAHAGQDADGAPTPGSPTYGPPLACRLVTGTQAAAALVALRLAHVADAVLSLPFGTALAATQTVQAGGATYAVVGTNAGSSYATALVVALKLVV